MISKKLSSLFLSIAVTWCGIIARSHAQEIASADLPYYRFAPTSTSWMTNMKPSFIIFANLTYDTCIKADLSTSESAKAYLDKIGLRAFANKVGAELLVLRPEGRRWNEADVENAIFSEYQTWQFLQNIKLIGFGDGATFVANRMTEYEPIRRVAGIVLYGGDMTEAPRTGLLVPAYLSNGLTTAEKYFRAINKTNAARDVGSIKIHYNSNYIDGILRVAVNAKSETEAQAVQNAWDTVLKYSYRAYLDSEYYRSASEYDARNLYNKPAILEPFPDMSELGIVERQVVTNKIGKYKTVNGVPFMYYVWVPESVLESSKPVPLVITFHGHANDTQMEGITSGFVSLSAEKKFIVVAPEWEGRAGAIRLDSKTDMYERMDLATQKAVLDEVCKAYPVDTSRIYAHGISAGGGATLAFGVSYPETVAAIEAHASLQARKPVVEGIENLKKHGIEINYMFSGAVNDSHGQWPVDPAKPGQAPNLFKYLNGVTLTQSNKADWKRDLFFGLTSYAESGVYETGEKLKVHWRILNNAAGQPKVLLAGIPEMSHWNLPGLARFIWDYWFSKFAKK